MAITTVAAFDSKTGTGWTIDVTVCNLSADLSQRDFIVYNNTDTTTFSNSDFTKTSQTVLTYGGASLSGTKSIEVRRVTPVSRYQEIQFGSKFVATDYNTEVDNILKKLNEIVTFGVSTTTVTGTVNDAAYGAGWNGDSLNSPSRNALYDQIELMPELGTAETITGNWEFDGTVQIDGNLDVNSTTFDATGVTTFTAPEPALGTNNQEVMTAGRVIDEKERYYLHVSGNASETFTANTTNFDIITSLPATATEGNSYWTRDGIAASYYTVQRTGWHRVHFHAQFSGSTNDVTRILGEIRNVKRFFDLSPGDSQFICFSGSIDVNLTSSTQIGPRLLAISSSGTTTMTIEDMTFSVQYLGFYNLD